MKRGLVIGKFMPVHKGHVTLIQFAATQCDELIVSMSYTSTDPISHTLRFCWLQKIFKNEPGIKPVLVKDDFDDESLPWPDRTKIWAVFLTQQFGKIDVLISSEAYGSHLAYHLNASHISFDPERKRVPVSASLIRKRPFFYWDYIPDIVRPCFVKKICLYGPESTGKSVMAKYLADYYRTEFVPEVAREIVTSNKFTTDDIIKIGHAHIARIQEKAKLANKVLFCDTDTITTQIYCRHYLNTVPDVLVELEKSVQYDRYFLFDIDVPWVKDGMRDLGEQRAEMLNVFRSELEKRNIPYTLVSGDYDQRKNFLISELDKLLSS